MSEIETVGQGPEASRLAELARAAAQGGADTELKQAAAAADPDQRSAAAKELADEQPAYQALHQALNDLDAQQ